MKNLFLFFLLLNCFAATSQSWQQLSGGISGTSSVVGDLEIYNGKLIVCGRFSSAGSLAVNNIAAWDGNNWSTLGNGLSSETGRMAVYNNDLYVSGTFSGIGSSSTCCVAKWDGISWSSIADSIRSPGLIYDMAVYNGSLIVAGVFTSINGVNANYIASWNGSNWNSLGTGLNAIVPYSTNNLFFNEGIFSLLVLNNELYCAGTFTMMGSIPCNNIAKWNGSSWNTMPGIVRNGYTHGYLKIQTFNSELYGTNGPFGLSKYDGSSAWNAIKPGLQFCNEMCVYDNKLIIGGNIMPSAGNYGAVIAYDGINWDFIGGNNTSNGMNNWVYALKIYSGQLYAGGNFDQCGGSPSAPLNRIGVYSGPININENIIGDIGHVFPNPSSGKYEVNFKENISYVNVTNTLGQTVFESKDPSTINNIDLSIFPNGIYLLNVQTSYDLNKTYKLIKN